MNKFILIVLLLLSIDIQLKANEPTLAILLSIYSNTIQRFNIGNYNFYCKSYGVISIEELQNNNKPDSACQEAINEFYRKNKHFKYYSLNLLKLKQRYHVEFKDNECILYSNAQVTLSEILLSKGLVLLKKNFKNREFNYSYFKAQETAKHEKRGMWSEGIPSICKIDE